MGNHFTSTVVAGATLLRRTGHADVGYPFSAPKPTPPVATSPVTSISGTGGVIAWTEATTLSTDVTTNKHDVYLNGVKQPGFTLDGTARNATLSGLNNGTTYNVQISRSSPLGGESLLSNVVTFTTTGTAPTTSVLMGVPNNGNPHGFSQWDCSRSYTYTDAINTAAAFGVKKICVTDSGTAVDGGSASATKLRNFLNSFYGGTGTPTKNASIECHFGNGNELDRKSPSSMLALANTCELMETVIADYPMASFWVDFTRTNLANGNSTAFWNATATSGRHVHDMIDGLAGSYYPTGRSDYPAMTPSSFTAHSAAINLFTARAAGTGLRMSVWEYGIPVLVNPPPLFPNPGTIYNDLTKRPPYIEAFVHTWIQSCLDASLVPDCCIYWDQQSGANKGLPSNTNIDVRWANDNGLTTPDSAHTWRRAASTF